jgi:hypothetical protein
MMAAHVVVRLLFGAAASVSLLLANPAIGQPSLPDRDAAGRKILRGPVGDGIYQDVRIVSDSVGIAGRVIVVRTVVIEAPVCIRTPGQGVYVADSLLNCSLCIEFTDSVLINNTLMNNRCSGRGTNRPDVFGW